MYCRPKAAAGWVVFSPPSSRRGDPGAPLADVQMTDTPLQPTRLAWGGAPLIKHVNGNQFKILVCTFFND